jgi:hypothetical protein
MLPQPLPAAIRPQHQARRSALQPRPRCHHALRWLNIDIPGPRPCAPRQPLLEWHPQLHCVLVFTPATSASLSLPAMLSPALPSAPPPLVLRLCVDRRSTHCAWNVRLPVAFKKSGRRYRSFSAWNHFPSSPTAAPAPSPAALPFCAHGWCPPGDALPS